MIGEMDSAIANRTAIKEAAAELAAGTHRRTKLRHKQPCLYYPLAIANRKIANRKRPRRGTGRRVPKAAAKPRTPKAAAKPKASPGQTSLIELSGSQPPMPDIAARNRFSYIGCRIYTVPERRCWRVMPKPGVSRYDKGFPWGKASPEQVWKSLIEYCKHPTLPASHNA